MLIYHFSSVKDRFYKCLDKIVAKYRLKLVAGNFFVTEFQPCLIEYNETLDEAPAYVADAIEQANWPVYVDYHQTPNTYDDVVEQSKLRVSDQPTDIEFGDKRPLT